MLAPRFSSAAPGLVVVRKTLTESRASTTTVANDAELVLPLAAYQRVSFSFLIYFEGATAAQFKFRLDGPSSPTLFRNRVMYVIPGATANTNAFQTAYANTNISSFTAATGGVLQMFGVLHNGANPGLMAFQWAQNTSDLGATIVYAGSVLQALML